MPLSATASGCGSQNKSNPISSSFQNKILPQTSIFHNESLIYNKHKNQPIDKICQHHLSHELLVIAVWFFELKELICKSQNCLNMSFMEWIIWSSPNFSGMGLYRVDCIPSTLHTLFFFFFFTSPSLAGPNYPSCSKETLFYKQNYVFESFPIFQ